MMRSRLQSRVPDDGCGQRDAGRVDHKPIQLTAPHHLGVARDDRDARFAAGVEHRALDPFQIGAPEPFFYDDRAGQAQGLGRPHHGEIVHRPGDRQPADVAAGEHDRVHDVRVGRDDEPAIPDPQRRAVIHGGEAETVDRRVEEAGGQRLLDQAPHRPPAGAVLEADKLLPRGRCRVDLQRGAHRSGWPPY